MDNTAQLLPKLSKQVVSGITGFKLCAYLVALEGWRRGLRLRWYKDEINSFDLFKIEQSTQGKYFSLSYESKTHFFFRSRGDRVSNETAEICQDKEKTKKYLIENGVPVPAGKVFPVSKTQEMINYAKEIGYPIIIKPLRGSMGRGVFTNIKDEREFQEILVNLKSEYNYSSYVVEKHYYGKEYRVYVVGDQVIGATNRIPANIVGDGKNSISNLIKIKNKERKKNPYLASKPIKIDYEVLNSLKRMNYDVDSIPKKGEIIYLREISNLSAGGDPIDATDELTNEVKQIAVNALKALPSIPHGGVDIIVDPEDDKQGVVLEVNATAEIGFHMFPLRGKARDIPAAIIDYYFPETKNRKLSQFFFDYKSALEPLKSWSTEMIEISPVSLHTVYGKKYIVSGKVHKVGYMNWVRIEALKRNIHGYAQHTNDGKIEIVVFSESHFEVKQFEQICKKGSKKSVVENVVVEEFDASCPIKMGFEIRKTDYAKKNNNNSEQGKTNIINKIIKMLKREK